MWVGLNPQLLSPDGRDTPALVAREKGLFFKTVASEAHTSTLGLPEQRQTSFLCQEAPETT